MADDLSNLNPSTTREWLQHISVKMDAMDKKIEEAMESQAEDRENLLAIVGKWDDWKVGHDKELVTNLKTLEKHSEKIDQLEKRVTSWSLTNAILAIGAFISSLFLKGS